MYYGTSLLFEVERANDRELVPCLAYYNSRRKDCDHIT